VFLRKSDWPGTKRRPTGAGGKGKFRRTSLFHNGRQMIKKQGGHIDVGKIVKSRTPPAGQEKGGSNKDVRDFLFQAQLLWCAGQEMTNGRAAGTGVKDITNVEGESRLL